MKRMAEIIREYGPFPGIEEVHGVSFDGRQVWFASGERLNALDPDSGELVGKLEIPADAGTAFDGRHLFQIAGPVIRKIDPETGEVLRSIVSDRFVTGVTWADGALWHGTWQGEESDIRRIDPASGAVLERLEMPPGTGVSELEADGGARFFCGGGGSGKLRVVLREPGPGERS